jgi:large subunit ribosomal protein L7/L12
VSGSTESDVQFWHAKAEDLFERITSRLSRDEVRVLADVTNAILGRPVRDNEFYYRGFGGRKGGGSSSGGAEAEGASAAQAAAQGKTTVDIKLVSFDAAAKLKVIKEVRSMLSELGLKDAKELVESAPKILQKGVSVEKAEELRKKLHEAGAEIELV